MTDEDTSGPRGLGTRSHQPCRRSRSAAEHLGKRIGDRVAFDDVSFEVGYGEVFGFRVPTEREEDHDGADARHPARTDLGVGDGGQHHALQVRKARYSSRDRTFDVADGEAANFRRHGANLWPIWLAAFAVPNLALSLSRE